MQLEKTSPEVAVVPPKKKFPLREVLSIGAAVLALIRTVMEFFRPR